MVVREPPESQIVFYYYYEFCMGRATVCVCVCRFLSFDSCAATFRWRSGVGVWGLTVFASVVSVVRVPVCANGFDL